MDLNDAIEKAALSAERRQIEDPELNKNRLMSLSGVVECFAVGAMRATPGLQGGCYSLPVKFESVVNWVSHQLHRTFGPKNLGDMAQDGVILFESSVNEVLSEMKSAAYDHPSFAKWNDPEDHRPFVDLDAVFQNVIVCIRERYGIPFPALEMKSEA